MDDLKIRQNKGFPHNISPDGIRYPPNSMLPLGFNHADKIKSEFSDKGASMLPKLQDYNQMFREKANSLIEMNTTILPPGHPLFSREHSLHTIKEENDKLLKENLELKKQLDAKSNKK
jgi:hypothetical protein|tara:strand:- start:1648 stop:2001 length:354 start_codon:yes stop_codon:yes gene_type:complete